MHPGNAHHVPESTSIPDDALRVGLAIRPPVPDDGAAVHRLIEACPPLDTNSVYCNLIQCRDFAQTCALAAREDEVVAFVSGYRPPRRPDTLFVWQVAVSPAMRGLGLGIRLMQDIIGRAQAAPFRYLQATVTPSNRASSRMFRSLAARLSASFQSSILFESGRHFAGAHESEFLLTIGPFGRHLRAVES